MKEYVEGLEQEFSAIERGFLHEQRRARSDYGSFDREQALRVSASLADRLSRCG